MQCTFFVLSSLACRNLHNFYTLLHKWHDFLGGGVGVTEHKMCVVIMSTISLSEKNQASYDHKYIFVFK